MRWTRWLIVACTGCLGCGTGALRATSSPDAPLPAGEPTASVSLALDLPQTQDCEEAFDLALYGNRAVHLIEWDGSAGRCAGRKATIVYLPKRITKDAVVAEARKRALKVSLTADR